MYKKDFSFCKAQDFHFDELIHNAKVDSDKSCEYNLELVGEYVYEGNLLLRTPLPAGILLKSQPSDSSIYIPDTSKALGFQKTVILPITDVSYLPMNEHGYTCFATGIFQIPTPENSYKKWVKLIPNSNGFSREVFVASSSGKDAKGRIVSKNDSGFLKGLFRRLPFGFRSTPPQNAR